MPISEPRGPHDHPDFEPHIFDEELEVLGILEDAGVATDVNDRVVAIVRRLCEQRPDGENMG